MGTNNNWKSFIITILIVIACGSQSINGLRILGMFPLNGRSHFVMCEQLMKGLAAKGHQVDVYSHFPLKKPIPNYTDYSLEGTMDAVNNNVTYKDVQIIKNPDLKLMLEFVGNNLCKLMSSPKFQQLFDKLKKEQPYDLVIVEIFVSHCYVAWGRYLNVPTIGVMTSGLIDWYNEPLGNPLNTAVTSSIWAPYHHPMSFWERLTNTLMIKYLGFEIQRLMTAQTEYIKQYFGLSNTNGYDILKDIDLLLVNSHHSIDGIRAYTPAIVPVAGMHIQDDDSALPKEVQKWLDDSKDGCIYMSFGSMVRIETFPKEVLDVFYETFKKIAPVRVLLKIAKPEELPAGLPSNVMTQPWFSQLKVLKHKNTKAFITHGGLMSTQESMSTGVPIIGIPLYGDQSINIKTQVRKNVAALVELDNISVDKFYAAIKEIISNPVYKKNAERCSKDFSDRPMSPKDTAIYWVEYISRHGKGALRSPVVDMPWWQAKLYDVYGFIVLVLVFAYFVLKFIVKKVLNLFYSLTTDKKKKKQ